MKIPLPTTLRNRRSDTDKDARILNGVVDGRGWICVRASINAALSPGELGPGWGLFARNTPSIDPLSGPGGSEVIVISNDVLTTSPTELAYRLKFSVNPPLKVNISTAFSPSVVVHALTRFGNLATGFNGTVNAALAGLIPPSFATLIGTTAVSASAGVATFSNIKVDRSGEEFQLFASATAVHGAYSTSFNAPTQLGFTTQPSDSNPDEQFTVVVAAQDSAGNTDTRYDGFITISIWSGSGGTLSGNVQKRAENGVVTFSDLSIDVEGTYTLRVVAEEDSGGDCYTPAARLSNQFNIGAYSLVATSNGFDIGYADVSLPGSSLTPNTFNGGTISSLYFNPVNGITMTIAGEHSQNFFTSITFNNVTLLSASADLFEINGGTTFWYWFVANTMFPSVGTYSGIIT